MFPPIVGWLYDMSGVYAGSLFLGGGMMMSSAVIMVPSLVVGWIIRHRHKKGYYSAPVFQRKTTHVISYVYYYV